MINFGCCKNAKIGVISSSVESPHLAAVVTKNQSFLSFFESLRMSENVFIQFRFIFSLNFCQILRILVPSSDERETKAAAADLIWRQSLARNCGFSCWCCFCNYCCCCCCCNCQIFDYVVVVVTSDNCCIGCLCYCWYMSCCMLKQ